MNKKPFVGYMTNSAHVSAKDSALKLIPMNAKPYLNKKEVYEALIKKEVDLIVDGFSYQYFKPKLTVFKEISNFGIDEIGMVFQPNSKADKFLRPIVNYYLNSPQFYELVRTHFGKDQDELFIRTLNQKVSPKTNLK